jgi:hypothetical protein
MVLLVIVGVVAWLAAVGGCQDAGGECHPVATQLIILGVAILLAVVMRLLLRGPDDQ